MTGEPDSSPYPVHCQAGAFSARLAKVLLHPFLLLDGVPVLWS